MGSASVGVGSADSSASLPVGSTGAGTGTPAARASSRTMLTIRATSRAGSR